VNSQPGSAIATGTIRGGQIAIGHSGRVHVTWNGSDTASPRGVRNPADGQATAPFLYTRSNMEGTRFEPQRNLTTRGYFIDGGGSIAADQSGNLYAAWHAAPVEGQPGEDHRLVWIARSTDDGATFAAEQPAWREPTGACGCCGVRLFAGPSDTLYLLYRSATAMTHRDMFLLESTDQGRTFHGSRVQPWEIGACPMTSMSIASSTSKVFGAWETTGQVYFGEIDSKARASQRRFPHSARPARGSIRALRSMRPVTCCSSGPKARPGHAEDRWRGRRSIPPVGLRRLRGPRREFRSGASPLRSLVPTDGSSSCTEAPAVVTARGVCD